MLPARTGSVNLWLRSSTAISGAWLAAAIFAAGSALPAASPAHAGEQIQIPLEYTYSFDAETNTYLVNRLIIRLGTNPTNLREYMFDTSSSQLVGQIDVPVDPNAPKSVALYGDGTYGNLVQETHLDGLYYKDADGSVQSFAGAPIVSSSLGVIYKSGSAIYQENKDKNNVSEKAIFVDPNTGDEWYADLQSQADSKKGKPAETDGTYGVFGAGNFLSVDDKYNAIGATTKTGYVISANANVQHDDPRTTLGCAPCVTLNLDSSLRSQFDTLLSWNAVHGNEWQATFPGTNTPASSQLEGAYTYEFQFIAKDGTAKTVTITGPALLDTGTPMEVLLSGNDVLTTLDNAGLDLTANTQKTITSLTVTGPDGDKAILPNAIVLRQGSPEAGPGITIGLPFFYQQSVMYDLQNQTTGFTPYFVTASNFTTSAPATGELGLSRITPNMGSQGADGGGRLGLAGVISGTGDLTIAAKADVRMTGVNTYTGATSSRRTAYST